MSGPTPPAGWLPALVDLLRRRPDLADIGYAPLAREVSS